MPDTSARNCLRVSDVYRRVRRSATSLIRRTYGDTVESTTGEEVQHLSLSQLPLEILQYIRDLLPLSSAGSFTLTSRYFKWALGRNTFRLLNNQEHREEKRRFLLQLQRGLLDWQLCYPCLLFHRVDRKIGPTMVWQDLDPPKCVRECGSIALRLGFQLRFQHAQLLMNRYRSRALHIKDLNMLSYKSPGPQYPEWLATTVAAAVVDDGLLLQWNSKWRLLPDWDIDCIERELPFVCPHIHLRIGQIPMLDIITCCVNHVPDLPCVECKRWKSCNECRTRFRLDIRELKTLETWAHLDVYKWLGDCETPFDPTWYKHCWDRPPPSII